MLTLWRCSIAALAVNLPRSAAAAAAAPQFNPSYRYLPGDPEWPSDQDWEALNETVRGNLIKGVPLAQSCYGAEANETECLKIENDWVDILPL
jgi:hypothetical protein